MAQGRTPNGTLLVVQSITEFPLRASTTALLDAPKNHSSARVLLLNVPAQKPSKLLRRGSFDVVFFDESFLDSRWDTDLFLDICAMARPLADRARYRLLAVQDEYGRPDLVAHAIETLKIDEVLTLAPDEQVDLLYPTVDRSRVTFTRVLPGYLEPSEVERLEAYALPAERRTIDVGYRARALPAWLGHRGQIKKKLGEAAEAAAPTDLKLDVSVRDEDVLFGDEWPAFLGNCRYVLGVEGGASLIERDGSLVTTVGQYQKDNPKAPYEEVAEACFPGRDGELDYRAISPRHLEACATRTCQILVEGDYNGILRPNIDYLPIRVDLSDLGQVLASLDETKRLRMVNSAYARVVASGMLTYDSYVELIETQARSRGLLSPSASRSASFRTFLNRASYEWSVARLRVALWLVAHLPVAAADALREVERRRRNSREA